MKYREAYSEIMNSDWVRRKYAPQHWLVHFYWAGVRVGAFWLRLRDNPVRVFLHGIHNVFYSA